MTTTAEIQTSVIGFEPPQVRLGDLIASAEVTKAGNGSYPLLSMTMHYGLVRQEDKFKKRVASRDLSQYKVATKGQLVVGFPIDEGVLSFQTLVDAGIVSPAYGVWDLLNPDAIDVNYLEKYLRSPKALSYYASKLRGSTARRRSLPREVFLAMPIPLPSVDEQRRIAAILDHANMLRTKRIEAIAHLDSLSKSIFHAMFGAVRSSTHPARDLGSLVRKDDKINYGVVQPGSDTKFGVPLIRIGDLSNGTVNTLNLKHIDPLIEQSYKRSRVVGDEILISCVGTIGQTALARPEMAGFNIARAVARVPLSRTVERRYVRAVLDSDDIQAYFRAELRTSSQPTLNIKQLTETRIPVPPKKLQEDFAERVVAVDRLRDYYSGQLAELDVLHAAIQHRAFSGGL
ncbi:restriction endonuclease subunit S [Pseudarthrobacter oxydans]|uniref:restriction endonuclease subunit S n=1 Tax=Pseudarthrobacter oxydans TaxID=1671 RepID=UPI003D2874E4